VIQKGRITFGRGYSPVQQSLKRGAGYILPGVWGCPPSELVSEIGSPKLWACPF